MTLRSRATRPGNSEEQAAFAETRAFLESGAAWPDEPPPECIETHASLVFLTRDRAWKLKKPVRLWHVDQSTLEARAHLCREELRLNRELAGDVYRGLVPLARRADGRLMLGGAGRIVDWLVESVRLPAEEMLDRRLARGPAPQPGEIEALCERLVTFYRDRPQSHQPGPVFHGRLLRESRINADHLREMRGELGGPLPEDLLDAALPAVEASAEEILARGEAGLIVEGHGDLRAEHVCLTRPPVVFDRVESDHDMRLLDPFFEVNALGLECAMAGAGWIRAVLLVGLSQVARPPSHPLLAAYGVVRCLTRARLALDHFRDAEVRTPDKWRTTAARQFEMAARLISTA